MPLTFSIILPTITTYVLMRNGAARQVFNTFDCVHDVEIQTKPSLPYRSVYWVCKTLIKFYSTLFATERDTFAKQVAQDAMNDSHSLRERVEALFQSSGVKGKNNKLVNLCDLLKNEKHSARE